MILNDSKISEEAINDIILILNRNNIEIDKNLIATKTSTMKYIQAENLYLGLSSRSSAPAESEAFQERIVNQDSVTDGNKFKYTFNTVTTDYIKFIEQNLNLNMSYAKIVSSEDNIITMHQFLGERRVYNNEINIKISENGSMEIGGEWINIKSTAGPLFEVRKITGILAEFLANKKPDDFKITDIELAYNGAVSDIYKDASELVLTPVYVIKTNKNIYFCDAVNGEFINSEELSDGR